MSERKIIGWGMTKTEKDREDIKLLFGEACDVTFNPDAVRTGASSGSSKRPHDTKI